MLPVVCRTLEVTDWAVIAGGVSVRGINTNALNRHDLVTVAVNSSAEYLPWVDYAFTIDCLNLRDRFDRIQLDKGKKVVALKPGLIHPLPKDTEFIPRLKWQERMSDKGIRTGNSAIGAYEFAIKSGARRVFLFGCDCNNWGHHWYDNINLEPHSDLKDETLNRWNSLQDVVETYNVSPTSAITRFPKINFQEFLCLLSPAS